ncbi:MAG: hypothetical protein OXP28_11300 [Gammaproteobacteria bacterium]|nr:hypothetical protein [Gammaproteobacteria bacterium]
MEQFDDALMAKLWYQAVPFTIHREDHIVMEWMLRNVARIAAKVSAFMADIRGVSTVEYALMVVAIIAAVALAAGFLGNAFEELFKDLSDEMTTGVGVVKSKVT